MRLTVRGWSVVAVVVLSVVMAWQYGPRALNAVVTPLVVVFVAGAITTGLADRPQIRRHTVTDGTVGDTRTVTVTIETDRPVSATVHDDGGDGLSAAEPIAAVTIDGEFEFTYEISLDERGDHRVGPLSITVVDLFGLFERRFSDTETTPVLVYPPVYDLGDEADRTLTGLTGQTAQVARGEFDHLREYQHGDSLRDVHWKAAARRPEEDLVVTEHVDDGTDSATIAAECVPDRADEMAAAVASIATVMLDANVRVGVILPDDRRRPATGQDYRYTLLGLLAVTDGGAVADRDRTSADVFIRTHTDGTEVVVGDRSIPFDRLRETRTRADSETPAEGAT